MSSNSENVPETVFSLKAAKSPKANNVSALINKFNSVSTQPAVPVTPGGKYPITPGGKKTPFDPTTPRRNQSLHVPTTPSAAHDTTTTPAARRRVSVNVPSSPSIDPATLSHVTNKVSTVKFDLSSDMRKSPSVVSTTHTGIRKSPSSTISTAHNTIRKSPLVPCTASDGIRKSPSIVIPKKSVDSAEVVKNSSVCDEKPQFSLSPPENTPEIAAPIIVHQVVKYPNGDFYEG